MKAIATKKAKLVEDPSYYAKIEAKKKATKAKHGHNANWCNADRAITTRRIKNEGAWETPEIRVKRKMTCIRKYGFTSPNSAPSVKAKLKRTCLAKYGVDSYSKTSNYHEQMLAVARQRKAKELDTKRSRGPFNSSKAEETRIRVSY